MPGIENDHQSNQIPHYSSQVQLSTLPVAVCFGDGKNHILFIIYTYHFPLVWLHFQLLLFCNCFRWNCYWGPRICCNQCPWISSDDDQMIRNCMEWNDQQLKTCMENWRSSDQQQEIVYCFCDYFQVLLWFSLMWWFIQCMIYVYIIYMELCL